MDIRENVKLEMFSFVFLNTVQLCTLLYWKLLTVPHLELKIKVKFEFIFIMQISGLQGRVSRLSVKLHYEIIIGVCTLQTFSIIFPHRYLA